jgi:hypothetical protein
MNEMNTIESGAAPSSLAWALRPVGLLLVLLAIPAVAVGAFIAVFAAPIMIMAGALSALSSTQRARAQLPSGNDFTPPANGEAVLAS